MTNYMQQKALSALTEGAFLIGKGMNDLACLFIIIPQTISNKLDDIIPWLYPAGVPVLNGADWDI